jgi:pimeloyl-ACP methyl ester carboxylesterase
MATSRSDAPLRERLHEADAGVHSGRLSLDGHALYWEVHAPGRPRTVALLHHGLGSVQAWHRQIPAFVAAGWCVLAFDRWGYGRSDPRPTFAPDFLAHDADEAVRLFDALGIRRLSLVGHSDGGSIALLIAAEHVPRIERLVSVAAHIYFEDLTGDGLHGIRRATRLSPVRDALQREHGEKAEALVQSWTDRWLAPDMRLLSMRPLLGKILCPTLVIQGEQDEHATPQHARDIAAGVRHGDLWLIPGVQHMPIHEVPDEFNRRVIEFLGQG